MKKTNKILLTGFAVAILGAFSMNLRAAAEDKKDCSVASSDLCVRVKIAENQYIDVSGKAKSTTPTPPQTPE